MLEPGGRSRLGSPGGGCDLIVARGIEAGGRAAAGIGLLPLLDSQCVKNA